MNTICQICGSQETETKTGTEIFDYKGHSIEVPEYTKMVCRNCGEAVAELESVQKSIPVLRDAQRTIDGLLTGKEIRNIRKSFNKTQDEFSMLLGGGEKAFARYETGKISQSKPMDNLLRILRVHPEAINALPQLLEKDVCTTTERVQYSPQRQECPFEYVIHEDNTMRKIMA